MNSELCMHDRIEKVTARYEVIRLLGVRCPEPEAQVVLQAVHDFKWLEAERAGFDVWAAIQPDCPLRSAAVHWARRYQPEFPCRNALDQREETRVSDTSFPYWVTRIADLPPELEAAGREVETSLDSPWLIFPCEQVPGESPTIFALRRCAGGLQALTATPASGSHVIALPTTDCCAVQIANVLLLGQFTITLKSGQEFRVRYNATGESKVNALLQPFLAELFRTERTAHPGAIENQNASSLPTRFSAALKMMLQPDESVLSVAVQSSAVEIRIGFSFWSRTISVPAGALVVTNKRIGLIAAELDGKVSSHGWTATLIPIRHVQGLQSSQIKPNLVSVLARFGGNSEASMRFEAKHTARLQQVIEMANRLLATG